MNTEKNNHWFPLREQGKSCMLKWGQVSLYLWTNKASNCHRNLSKTIPDNFDFNNIDLFVEHRKKMFNGEWPSDGNGCEHCRDQEAVGGISDRLQWLGNDYNKRYVPIELENGPGNFKSKPTQLSVHFNNKCNMKCVYCGPNLSSAWVKEVYKHEQNIEYNIDPWELDKQYKARVEKFYEWMEENYSSLKAFDILGGEPFIQLETFDCIDWMIAHPNKEVDFEIYSNMQIKFDLFKRGIDKVRELTNHVNRVDFVASIDCWGAESEYIRHGLDLEVFERNWEYLLKECPEINPTMNWTVSSLSIPSTVPLIKKVIEWQKIRPVSVNYNKCVDPIIFDPHIMPPGFYQEHIEQILELNEIMYGNNQYKEYPKTIFKEINETPADYHRIQNLKNHLDMLDFRRNTNWRETFPWLENVR
jgi:hypothetical protein